MQLIIVKEKEHQHEKNVVICSKPDNLTLRERRDNVQPDTGGAGALARDRHPTGITTECSDVVLDELQRAHLVEQTQVARQHLVLRRRETCE